MDSDAYALILEALGKLRKDVKEVVAVGMEEEEREEGASRS